MLQIISDQVELYPGSREERLPGFTPQFPHISSHAILHSGSPWHWHKSFELFYMEHLHILNLKSFLQELQACTAPVELTLPDGSVHAYPDTPAMQELLAHAFTACKKFLPLTIAVHSPQDYFSVVSYYAGL